MFITFFNIQKNDTCPKILETGGNLDEVNIRTKDIVNIKVRKKKRKKKKFNAKEKQKRTVRKITLISKCQMSKPESITISSGETRNAVICSFI